jgi:rhodanese-related sulfurtransferase
MITNNDVIQFSVDRAHSMLESGAYIAIDIRMPFDFAGGRIPGSINLPNTSIKVRKAELPAGKALLFVSNDGSASLEVCRLAAGLGFGEVANLEGGIEAWSDAGYELETISEGLTSQLD